MKPGRIAAALLLMQALPLVIVPSASSALAQDNAACTRWIAEMIDDEGGQVLTAQACSTNRPDAYISITCSDGTAGVRFDLAAGAETPPQPNEVTDVKFKTSTDEVTLQMGYEEYDGAFAAYPGADDPLIQLLKAGDTVTVSDLPGVYPAQSYSLAGSSAALGRLTAACR